jgi:thioredoxin-like negative regulator of GroEL
MSLLNDALRKKRIDQQPEGICLTSSLPIRASRSNRKHKLKWTIIIGVCVMVAVICGGRRYWAEPDTASDLRGDRSLAGTSNLPPDSSEEKPAVGNPTVESPPIASKMPEVAAPTRVESTPATVNVRDFPMKTNIQPSVVPPAAKIPPKVPPKPNAVSRQEKETAKLAPRKKSPSKTHTNPSRVKAAEKDAASQRLQCEILYKKARQYHRQGRIHQAIDLYQEVIKVNPEHYKARFNLSAAYLRIEAYHLAYPIITELHRREPDNQQVKLNLAIAHIGHGRYPEAIELLDQAAGQPSAPMFEIAFHKGVAYSHMNQTQTALDWYKRSEALRPEDPGLLFNLAVLSDQQQQFKAAVDYYSRYIDLTPGIDALKEKQIRKRIRTLLTYCAESNFKEKSRQ